jgi:hypothetical protein
MTRPEEIVEQYFLELDKHMAELKADRAEHTFENVVKLSPIAPGGLDDDFNAPLFNVIFPAARDYMKSNTVTARPFMY